MLVNSSYSFIILVYIWSSTVVQGFYDQSQVNEMMRESVKMAEFDHPNVLALIGVCTDGGPAPYIVTPFMANGSLLAYLRENRSELIPENDVGEEQVRRCDGCCMTTIVSDFPLMHTGLCCQ